MALRNARGERPTRKRPQHLVVLGQVDARRGRKVAELGGGEQLVGRRLGARRRRDTEVRRRLIEVGQLAEIGT